MPQPRDPPSGEAPPRLAPVAAAPGMRVVGLDAARGAAMLLVFLSHFADVYLEPAGLKAAENIIRPLTFMATPAFMLVSGFVMGYLSFMYGPRFDRIRRKLFDRALVLLLPVHILLAAADAPRGGFARAFNTVYVTDAVAACVMAGTLMVPWIGARARLVLAAGLYLGATLAAVLWSPAEGSTAQLMKHLLFGHALYVESALAYNFPLAQWLSVYLVGTALGEAMGRSGMNLRRVVPRLVAAGAASWLCGMFLWRQRPALVDAAGRWPEAAGMVAGLFSPWQKLPPGPVYVGLFVGAALLMVAGWVVLASWTPAGIAVRPLSMLGRNSLVAFVLQSFVYYSLLLSFPLPPSPMWPLLFVASVAVILGIIVLWRRAGGHRLLTLGYPALVAWADARAVARGGPLAALVMPGRRSPGTSPHRG